MANKTAGLGKHKSEAWAADRAAALGVFQVILAGAKNIGVTRVVEQGRGVRVRPAREFLRARDDFEAAVLLRGILKRAQAGDPRAKRLWNRACGMGQGDSMSVAEWHEREAIVRVLIAPRRRQAFNQLIEDWDLGARLVTLNSLLAKGYGKTKRAKEAPTLPIERGAKLSDADYYKALDAALSLASSERDGRDPEIVDGDRIKKMARKYLSNSPGIWPRPKKRQVPGRVPDARLPREASRRAFLWRPVRDLFSIFFSDFFTCASRATFSPKIAGLLGDFGSVSRSAWWAVHGPLRGYG